MVVTVPLSMGTVLGDTTGGAVSLRKRRRSNDSFVRGEDDYIPSSGTLPPQEDFLLSDGEDARGFRHDTMPPRSDEFAVYRTDLPHRRPYRFPSLPLAKQRRTALLSSGVRGRYTAISRMRPMVNAYFCAQRKIRRQVIFATGRGGRNGARVYRRSAKSYYRC